MDLEKVFNYFIKGLILIFLGIILVCNLINDNSLNNRIPNIRNFNNFNNIITNILFNNKAKKD